MNVPPELSFSMIIDDELLESKIEQSKKKGSHEDLKTLSLEKRSIHKWEKDDHVTHCRNCKTEFGLFLMKHHCRMCGRIFCYSCANNYIKPPKNIELPKAQDKSFGNYVSNSLGFSKDKGTIRVCKKCLCKVNDLKKAEALTKVFAMLEIQDIKNITSVSRTWNKAGIYYLSQYREIQYKLPFNDLTNFDKDSLWINRRSYRGHSVWLKMLIKSIDHTNEEQLNEIIPLFVPDRKYSCFNLMCTRTCQPFINPEDVIELLNINYINPKLEPFLMKALFRAPKEEIICYTSQIIHYLTKTKSNIVMHSIITKCSNDYELISSFYFDFNIIANLFPQFVGVVRELKHKFIQLVTNKEFIEKLQITESSLRIFDEIKNISNTDDLKVKISSVFDNKIMIPILPNNEFVEFDDNFVEVKESYWKPIVLKLIDQFGNGKKLLLKKEDVVKDFVINKIISLMDYLIKKEEEIDCHVVKYRSYPIKSDIGIIEIVDEADTIFNITNFRKFTIQNYIMEQNPTETVQELRKRFTRSTAAYCVITFLLGIGDRHLDNIMVHNSGSLFHIDYGYILGTDPKFKDPFIRITHGMLDAMGGENSENYELFKKLCNSIYSTMRRHQNIIITLISFLCYVDNRKYNNVLFEKHILKRFEPGLNFKDAENHLYKIMEKSHNNSWRFGISDFLHSSFRNGYSYFKSSHS